HGRPDEDAFVCGDDTAAKALALELAAKVVAGRALDAGPLASARALEAMTAVIVNLNKRYKGHAGIRVPGLPWRRSSRFRSRRSARASRRPCSETCPTGSGSRRQLGRTSRT